MGERELNCFNYLGCYSSFSPFVSCAGVNGFANDEYATLFMPVGTAM